MPALAILGMHRSYTSLAARWLGACGLDLGQRTLGSGVGNEDGHFEDLDFYQFHIDLLRAHGLPSNGMVDIARPVFNTAAFDRLQTEADFVERGRAMLARKGASGKPFAWKEPRTCLFLPFYRAEADLRSLIMFRPFEQVVASLVSREFRFLKHRKLTGWRRPIFWLRQNSLARRVQDLRHGYLAAWNSYNLRLLKHIDACDPDKLLVHDLASLIDGDKDIIARLNTWGFACEYRPLGALVRPASERENLMFEPEMLQQAEAISVRFRDLIAQG